MDVKWIKIVPNIFEDEKIRFIETLPNGDAIIVIWFKLLCMTGKSNVGGFIMMTEKIAYTDEMLASIFNRDIKLIKFAIETFTSLDMVEVIDNKYYISNWSKYQNVEGLDKIREQTRIRVAKHRERAKELEEPLKSNAKSNAKSNVTITQSNTLDIDKELDKEYKYIYSANIELENAFNDFLTFRKKIKAPMTDRAIELLKSNLDALAGDDDTKKIAILNRSILNNWKGVFALKTNNNTFNTNKQEKPVPEWYDDYEKDLEETKDEKMSDEEIEAILAEARELL